MQVSVIPEMNTDIVILSVSLFTACLQSTGNFSTAFYEIMSKMRSFWNSYIWHAAFWKFSQLKEPVTKNQEGYFKNIGHYAICRCDKSEKIDDCKESPKNGDLDTFSPDLLIYSLALCETLFYLSFLKIQPNKKRYRMSKQSKKRFCRKP